MYKSKFRRNVPFGKKRGRQSSMRKRYEKKKEVSICRQSRPRYNPDIVPSDYHLFRFTYASLNSKLFNRQKQTILY